MNALGPETVYTDEWQRKVLFMFAPLSISLLFDGNEVSERKSILKTETSVIFRNLKTPVDGVALWDREGTQIAVRAVLPITADGDITVLMSSEGPYRWNEFGVDCSCPACIREKNDS